MSDSSQTNKTTDTWHSHNGREKHRGKQQLSHQWMRPCNGLCNTMSLPVLPQVSAQTLRQRRMRNIAVGQTAYPWLSFQCVVRSWQFFAHISHPKRGGYFSSVPIFLLHFLLCECDSTQKNIINVQLLLLSDLLALSHCSIATRTTVKQHFLKRCGIARWETK